MRYNAGIQSKIRYAAFILLFTLIAFELVLRIFKVNTTYSEKIGEGYATYYNQVLKTWYYTWPKDSAFVIDHGDFKYPYKTNSLGLREKEFTFNKPDAKHIICIGDSYTEGMGAPYDSSFPRLLENHFNQLGLQTEVLNAGASGSDPFFEYKLYKDKLLPAHAQYLFICINSTDITDVIFRGGLSRFKPNGTTVSKSGPWFEKPYHYSYIARFMVNNVFGYPLGNLFVRDTTELNSLSQNAANDITALMDSLNNLSANNNCKLLVVLQPQITELAYPGGQVNENTKKLFKSIEQKLEAGKIPVINLWEPLALKFNAENRWQYSYAHDAHYNPAGYDYLSLALLDELSKKYPSFLK